MLMKYGPGEMEPIVSHTTETWVATFIITIHGSLNVPIEHHPTIRYMVFFMATIRWCPIFPKWDSYQPLTICNFYMPATVPATTQLPTIPDARRAPVLGAATCALRAACSEGVGPVAWTSIRTGNSRFFLDQIIYNMSGKYCFFY